MDPWEATREANEVMMGRVITDEIDSDQDEVAALRKARAQARQGVHHSRHDDA